MFIGIVLYVLAGILMTIGFRLEVEKEPIPVWQYVGITLFWGPIFLIGVIRAIVDLFKVEI